MWAKSGIQANTHENYYNKLSTGRGAGASNGSASGGSTSGAKPRKKGKKGRR